MAVNELQLLQDSLSLIRDYTQGNEQIRQQYQTKGFKGKPLFFYIPILVAQSNDYRNYYMQVFHAPPVNAKTQVKLYLKKILKGKLDPGESDPIFKFLDKCYKDKTHYNQLYTKSFSSQISSLGMFSPEELEQIHYFSQLPEGSQKANFFNKLISQLQQKHNIPTYGGVSAKESGQEPVVIKTPLEKKVKIAAAVRKGFLQRKGRLLPDSKVLLPIGKKIIIKAAPNLVSATVLGAAGTALGGVTGGVVGAVSGGALPMAIKSRSVRTLLGAGGKALLGMGSRGAALLTGPPGWIALGLSLAPQTAKKLKWVAVGVGVALFVIIFMMPGGLFETGTFLPPPGVGEAAPVPIPSGGGGLGYSIPFRDSTITVANPQAIKQQVMNNWPNAQIQNWDTIVSQSITHGWNPAFVLTLWIEETGAQGAPNYTDPLGCDPNHPTTDINISLGCLFNSFNSYSNDKFADFMCMYSESKLAPCEFKTNPNFPGNIKKWYSQLVPSGPGAITTPTPPPRQPPQKEFALTCPIANEYNTCSDYYDPRDPCHCNVAAGFVSMSACAQDPSLYYGIDVGTKASSAALIPYIIYQGETMPRILTCRLMEAQKPPTCPATGCEWQQILHYHCPTDKVDLYLQYNHIKANPAFPQILSSGQAVGDVANYGDGLRRLNIQIGIGGECAYGQTQFCRRGGEYFQCPLKKEPLDY